MPIHQTAARGFEHGAQAYEEARPSYPLDAIEYIRSISPMELDVIVDLGAGTGKLTRRLNTLNARKLIAVEPVTAMRDILQTIPIVDQVLDGSAEHIPLEANSVDIVLCGQAFHWFANHRALAEIHRVLKPTGRLVMLWNRNDRSGCPWWTAICDSIEDLRASDTPRYVTMEWKSAFDDQNYFAALEHRQFSNRQLTNRDLLVKRILSTSFVSALPNDEQQALLDDIRKKLETTEDIRGRDEFEVLYLTDVFHCAVIKSSE